MTKKLIIIMILLMAMTVSKTYAQGSADPGGAGTNDPVTGGNGYGAGNNDNPSGGVPFDGGLSLILIAAGAGLKAKRKTYKVSKTL